MLCSVGYRVFTTDRVFVFNRFYILQYSEILTESKRTSSLPLEISSVLFSNDKKQVTRFLALKADIPLPGGVTSVESMDSQGSPQFMLSRAQKANTAWLSQLQSSHLPQDCKNNAVQDLSNDNRAPKLKTIMSLDHCLTPNPNTQTTWHEP